MSSIFINTTTTSQVITTIVGNGIGAYSGDGGVASAAQLHYPYCVKIDQAGNKFIADTWNHVVRKISVSGIITTVAGNGNGAGTWTGGYSGDGGQATNSELSKPIDLAFDNLGNLFIAESGNRVIRKVNTAGIISTFAGTGIGGDAGDGGAATAAQITNPLGLVFDTIGNLYFSQNGYFRVRKISTSGTISTVAGTGVDGYSGDGGPASAAKIGLTGYLAFAPNGDLYIPDYMNHRIRKVDAAGNITTVVGNGIAANTGDGGNATGASINGMWAIFFDQTGNMYLSDRTTPLIRKIDTANIITTIAGTGVVGYGGDEAQALFAQFRGDMHCSAIDCWGNVYIADPFSHRIRRINYNTSAVVELTNNQLYVTISPNPASNEITISANDKIKTIVVVDMLGQVVIETNYNKKQMVIDIRFLSPGLYTVKVNNAYAGRFVKE